MENLAPDLKRQRLLVEGFFSGDVDEARVKDYFNDLCRQMGFQAYGEPIIHSPDGLGKTDNQGYDAFLPLIDSGISVYIWSAKKFFSIIIYTCKDFDADRAVEITKLFWDAEKTASQSF
jgi:S-adenosylmethionine/arginine decarboxylase-like enzyme